MRVLRTARVGVVTAVTMAMVVGLSLSGASATEQRWALTDSGWTVSFLPMPDAYPDARAWVTGTDSRGGYSGFIDTEVGAQIVTWRGGTVAVRGIPTGFEFAASWDQNRSGTVVGDALDYDTGNTQTFTLDSAKFRLLPAPAGYSATSATAINNRGDVVGQAHQVDGTSATSVVWWPASERDQPVVLDVALTSVSVSDIDDDGTIVLNSDSGPHVWKAGMLRKLAEPAGYARPHASAIRNGLVVGSAASPTRPGAQGFLWRTPTDPRPLPGSDTAREINGFGLIVGREPIPASPDGPLATWLGTYPVGRLPMPEGYDKGAAGAVGDDGSIGGLVSTGPLDEGGRPVIWRHSVR